MRRILGVDRLLKRVKRRFGYGCDELRGVQFHVRWLHPPSACRSHDRKAITLRRCCEPAQRHMVRAAVVVHVQRRPDRSMMTCTLRYKAKRTLKPDVSSEAVPLIHHVVAIIGIASLALAAMYAVLVLVALSVWRARRNAPIAPALPLAPVTLLKPLCGSEPGLYNNLRSFCEQKHPSFQIVFGVRDPADPALQIVRRLVAEFPELLIDVVINPQQHGSNCKVSNLINMLPSARYDLLIMADSDASVSQDYLRAVTMPLLDQSVGLVTCIYRGIPTPLICSRLGAMFINEWYMPSVVLAWLFGHRGYASGQTLALRRATLTAIGGLEAMANHLADDNLLGEKVRQLGLRVVLSPFVPAAEHHEPDLQALTDHELRWMCTLRVLRPFSFRLLFLSFSTPLAVLGMILAAQEASLSRAAWSLLWVSLVARVLLHFSYRARRNSSLLSDFWLLPARDLLTCWVWFRSFFASRVRWRDIEFDLSADGLIRRLP
jgi:ceramide glucosyltransferase